MISIICIIESRPEDMLCYNTTFLPFETFKTRIDVNLDVAMVIHDNDNDKYYSFNFLEYLKNVLGAHMLNTWDDICATLSIPCILRYHTLPIVPTYLYTRRRNGDIAIVPCPVSTAANTSPNIISISHSSDFITGYASRKKPNDRNNNILRHQMTDVVISHAHDNKEVLDFNNCIPVINGKVHFPIVFDDELWAVDGTAVLASQTEGGSANILLDFSPMGGVSCVRLADCTLTSNNDRYELVLPDEYSLANKTYILVLAGRIFLDYETTKLTDHRFSFNVKKFNLDNILLSNIALQQTFIRGTTIAKTYARDYMEHVCDVDNYENFVIIVDNPKIKWHYMRPLQQLSETKLKFPPTAGGVLLRRCTREVIDYTRQVEQFATIVSFSPPVKLNKVAVDRADNYYNIGYTYDASGALAEHSISESSGSYVLIDVVANVEGVL